MGSWGSGRKKAEGQPTVLAAETSEASVDTVSVALQHESVQVGSVLATVSAAGSAAGEAAPHGNYTKLRRVGRGGQGTVHQVQRRSDGQMFALKEIFFAQSGTLPEDQAKQLHRLDREIRALRQLSWADQWIVHLEEHWATQCTPKTFVLIMEFMPLSLQDWSNARVRDQLCQNSKLELSQLQAWLAQLLAAMHVVHQHNIIHRDIKPSNILLTGDSPCGRAKIADFGLARGSMASDLPDSNAGSQPSETSAAMSLAVGTRGYIAPECLGERNRNVLALKPYGPPCDIFSLGQVVRNVLPLFAQAEVSELWQLSEQMTKEDPRSRPTVDKICAHCLIKANADQELQLVEAAKLDKDRKVVTRDDAGCDTKVVGRPEAGQPMSTTSKLTAEATRVQQVQTECAPPVAFMRLDSRGRVTMWSEGLVKILGIPQEQVKGRSLMEGLVPKTQQSVLQKLITPVILGTEENTRGCVMMLDSGKREVAVVIAVNRITPLRESGMRRDPHIRNAMSALKPALELSVWAGDAFAEASEARGQGQGSSSQDPRAEPPTLATLATPGPPTSQELLPEQGGIEVRHRTLSQRSSATSSSFMPRIGACSSLVVAATVPPESNRSQALYDGRSSDGSSLSSERRKWE